MIVLAFFLAAGCLLAQAQQLPPTVFVALFVRNKDHLLNQTLTLLEAQEYPKSRIILHVRSDHNEDDSAKTLQQWLQRVGKHYHWTDVEIDHDGAKRYSDQTSGPLEWTESRFGHMIDLKERALEKARRMWADWIWFLDADAFITNPYTLKEMTEKNHLVMVAPMLASVGLYSNFWAGMTETFYYKRTDEYKLILNRKKKGCFPVPMIHSSFLINLNRQESRLLSFKLDDPDVPTDDIIRLALSAQFSRIEMNICNQVPYGFIMLPLDDEQTLQDDVSNFSNLKIEMFAYGHSLHVSAYQQMNEPKEGLGVDRVYLINLDRRPDRLRNMEAIFNELNVRFERVNAVDGKKDVNEAYLQGLGIKMMVEFSEPYHGRPLTYGEIGCFMSHYNVWKDVIQSNHQEVLVFEDDVRFEPFFKQKLSAVRQELVHLALDWDLIFLGRKILANMAEEWVDQSQWLVHVNYTYWTLGYMLTNRGAQKLLNEEPLGKMVPVDEYLPIMYDRHPNESWKAHYKNRSLVAFSIHPLLLYPTHYTGEEGYISDTEDTPLIHDEL